MENNRELNEMIFQNYGELYDAMLNYLRENCLVTHFPIQGDRYDEQSNKLLLVGRSLNGWGCKDEYSGAFQYEKAPARDDYVEKAYRALFAKHRYGFIEENRIKHHYDTIARSAFWRTAKLISSEIVGFPPDEANWYERIAWANLFPATPSEGGNPSDHLISAQRPIARKLLNQTIDVYKPTHILFVTGWDDWLYYRTDHKKGDHFQCMLDDIPEAEIKAIADRKKAVIWGGLCRGAKIVIANRPERKAETEYVKSVLRAFQDI